MPWTEDVNWDLDGLIPAGPDGPVFSQRVRDAEQALAGLTSRADAIGAPGEDADWSSLLPALMTTSEEVHELYSFAVCYTSANAADPVGHRAAAQVSALATRLKRAWTRPTDLLARADDASLDALCADPALSPLRPMFEDIRAGRHLLLPLEEQSLYTELSESGIHAWSRRYDRIAGDLSVTVDGRALSSAQAQNLLESPDHAVRAAALAGIEAAWGGVADPCAEALTHIYGARRVLYSRLGVDELAEPLSRCRVSRATLEAQLEVASRARDTLWRYFDLRAAALGKDQLDWCDLRVQLGDLGRPIPWAEAQDFVAGQFATFSTDMARFAADAFANRWVEAEDRSGKRPGAFCSGFPLSRVSRVFMTYGEGLTSVLTLAHELGHAWHNHTMRDMPPERRRLTSTLAETASTFAEALVRGAAMDGASSDAERLALLGLDLSYAESFLVNIPVRFHFERALHRMRADGPLDPAALSDEMEALQRAWYGPSMGQAHPLFWANKLHFYLSNVPFYNFPYTFGYLFSGLVHARAMAEGSRWAQGYVDLLRDTGAGPAEVVAQKHLGLDLTDPDAYQPLLERLSAQVDQLAGLIAQRQAAELRRPGQGGTATRGAYSPS